MKRIVIVGVMALGFGACRAIDDAPADYRTMHESRQPSGEKEMDVNIRCDIGRIEILRSRSDLYSFDLEYDSRRVTPRFSYDPASSPASFRLATEHEASFMGHNEHNDLTLRLTDAIPLDLDLSAGVSDAHYDMTGLQVRRMHLRGGVGRAEVFFDQPVKQQLERLDIESGVGSLSVHGLGNVHAQRIDLSGGVGKTELDFTGEPFESRNDTDITVGVGQIQLLLPKDAGIEIEGEGSFLSNINAPSFQKDGRTYMHPSEDGSPTKLFIRVHSGVGGVSIELM